MKRQLSLSGKRILAVLMCVLTLLPLIPTAAFAASNVEIESSDTTSYFEYISGGGTWEDLKTPLHYIAGTNEVAYCLQHKKSSPHIGNNFNEVELSDFYSTRVLRGLLIILERGYPCETTSNLTASQARYATANAIRFWLSENGDDDQYNFTNRQSNPGSIRANSGYQKVLDFADELLGYARNLTPLTHKVTFSPATLNLTPSGDYFVGTTTVTLTNCNGGYVLDKSSLPSGTVITGDNGKDGDTLTIKVPSSNASKTITLKADGLDNRVSANIFMYASTSSSIQNVIVSSGGYHPAGEGALTLITPAFGKIKLVKTSEDGKVSGVTFTVTGNGVNTTVTTGTDGTIEIPDLLPGTYTVTEQPSDRYVTPSSQNVTVQAAQTATVTFNNVLKRGGLKVTKTSEDGLVAGVKFHLYGTSLSGAAVDVYATTDANGVATFSDILIGGSTPYTLEEVDTAIRYVIPLKQNATVNWNTVTGATMNNILKKWRVTVTKVDRETGTPQGDASLANAVYGIYDGNTLVDTYTTDAKGQFTSKYYVCGDNWTVREITPSEGYLLDTTIHHVGAEAKNFTIERNSVANNVNEQVIKGKISIIKHTDNGETQIETPEAGAEFQIYLASSGSYDKAKPTERDVLTCDENGFAETKLLPYGVYTVHQTKGWDGRELMKDFSVYIRKDGFTYRYLINNANFASYIKIVKTDVETGKTIPYAGAGFQIYAPDGSLVEQTFTYPTVTTIDTFYTNDEGYLVTPEKLEYGKGYSLVEVQAPYGYVLDSTPVKFDVVQENSEDESGVTVIEVKRPNMAQKGIITVEKTGEVFISVTESDGVYQPVYEVQGLPGAEYDIVAAEDIITPDGTVRAEKDEVVDTITTDDTGTAQSCELYLGRYSVIERVAPYGMVLNEEVHSVELTYAGQEISVTETATSFYNERQRVEISLDKSLEQDEQFGIGMNGEIFDVTFGLFAAGDITAADGSVIPADGLIEIITLNENGHGVAKTDLPVDSGYYLKELSTNAAYRPSDEQYPIVFEYEGQDTAVVKLAANDGEAIENELLRGSLKLIKTFEGRETPIAGVPFTITGVTVTGATATIEAVTDENGEILLENLPIGRYTIVELNSELTAGYVLSNEITVNIVADYIEEVAILNKLMHGDLQIIKTFEGKDTPIAGVKFTVTGKTLTGEDYYGEFETDENGCITIENLLVGDYTVQEIESDLTVGYVLSEEQTATVAHEQLTEMKIENKLIRGNVKLVKTDKENGAKLAGAVFELYAPDGEQMGVYATDKNGELFIKDLPYGFGYRLTESKAAEGYKLGEVEFTFDIKENGVTLEFSAVNEKIPTPDNPKTGDDRNPILWIAIAGISAAALIGLGIYGKRKKMKKGEHHGA